MIVIVDYNMGNTGSIANMIKHVGGESIITNDYSEIEDAKKLILPGVGSFDTGIQNLKDLDLVDILMKKALKDKIPMLGVCLGMQLLSKRSEEGEQEGLGLIDAETLRFRFPESSRLSIPCMGWNDVKINGENKGIFEEMYPDPRFYFDHSYHLVCKNSEDAMCTSEYGYEYVSGIHRDNIYGVQFHPEKSHKYGMKLFENFINM